MINSQVPPEASIPQQKTFTDYKNLSQAAALTEGRNVKKGMRSLSIEELNMLTREAISAMVRKKAGEVLMEKFSAPNKREYTRALTHRSGPHEDWRWQS